MQQDHHASEDKDYGVISITVHTNHTLCHECSRSPFYHWQQQETKQQKSEIARFGCPVTRPNPQPRVVRYASLNRAEVPGVCTDMCVPCTCTICPPHYRTGTRSRTYIHPAPHKRRTNGLIKLRDKYVSRWLLASGPILRSTWWWCRTVLPFRCGAVKVLRKLPESGGAGCDCS